MFIFLTQSGHFFFLFRR